MIRISRRRLNHLRRASTWTTLATDLGWRLRPGTYTPRPLSWQVDDRRLRGLELRRPASWAPGVDEEFGQLFSRLSARVPVVECDVPQLDDGVPIFELRARGRSFTVAVDLYDYPPLNTEIADGCDLYFKLQYLRQGYGRDHVIPGGYAEPRMRLVQFLPRLRRLRDAREFHYDVHARFSSHYAPQVRGPALALLEGQSELRHKGGLDVVLFTRFLREVCHARVCVDLPGNGPFCHRLVDYFAIGSCVVAFPHETVLHVPLENGRHIVYTKADLSDLVSLCAYYVEHDRERELLARESREFYDRYLHWDQLAAYYLHCLVERLT